MNSKLIETLRLEKSPVGIILTNDKPENAVQFKEGAQRGCVASMLLASSKGKTVAFDKNTFGCPGGGVGLGFGNCYTYIPIEKLLSTGGKVELEGGHVWDMKEGERFFDSPETTGKWVDRLPFREIAEKFVVYKPFDNITEADNTKLILMFVNADQLSALITLIGFRRGTVDNAIAPWGAACQSILFGYKEAESDMPRGVIGFFDISQRHRVDKDTLSFTVPYKLFLEMEVNVEECFFSTDAWKKIQERL